MSVISSGLSRPRLLCVVSCHWNSRLLRVVTSSPSIRGFIHLVSSYEGGSSSSTSESRAPIRPVVTWNQHFFIVLYFTSLMSIFCFLTHIFNFHPNTGSFCSPCGGDNILSFMCQTLYTLSELEYQNKIIT